MKVQLKLKKNGQIIDTKNCKTKAMALKLAKSYMSSFTMHEKVKQKADYSIVKTK
jgi:hypothetical protein